MKKVAILSLGIIFTTTSAVALIDHYQNIPVGEYHCPEKKNETCIINKYKTGEITFGPTCLENASSSVSKYAPMIKREQCEAIPDPGKYYNCEFADATCKVIFYASKTSVSCTNNSKIATEGLDYTVINKRILEAAKAGQCKDLFPVQTTETTETTETTTPEVQTPQAPTKSQPAAKPKIEPDIPADGVPEVPQPEVPTIQEDTIPPLDQPDRQLLDDIQRRYKETISQEIEKQLQITPIRPDVAPNIENIDIEIRRILEKYDGNPTNDTIDSINPKAESDIKPTEESNDSIQNMLNKYNNLQWQDTSQ